MIWGKWVDPNFKFRATDSNRNIHEHFCYATTEDSLRSRLTDKKYTVEWVKSYDFTEWKDRAKSAKNNAIQAHSKGTRPIPFDKAIWTELKWHLFELFHGKCAYCESITLHVASGDVEHYRPKSKVTDNPDHPGYYWLAYNINNLLPSCERCNRARGKMNRFPIKGRYVVGPDGEADGDLDSEDPLLLNPYNQKIDPFDHLEFDKIGIVKSRNNSQYGQASEKCYYLNRSELSVARRAELANVEKDWGVAAIQLGFVNGYKDLRGKIIMGDRQYSAAQLWELERVLSELSSSERTLVSAGV